MVLFLFVIMLLDVDERERAQPNLPLMAVGLVVTGVVVAILLHWVGASGTAPEVGAGPTDADPLAFAKGAKAFGYALLTKYMLPVQVAGFLLLVAMIGVIMLGRKGKTQHNETEGDL